MKIFLLFPGLAKEKEITTNPTPPPNPFHGENFKTSYLSRNPTATLEFLYRQNEKDSGKQEKETNLQSQHLTLQSRRTGKDDSINPDSITQLEKTPTEKQKVLGFGSADRQHQSSKNHIRKHLRSLNKRREASIAHARRRGARGSGFDLLDVPPIQYSSLTGPAFVTKGESDQFVSAAGTTAVLLCKISNLHNYTVSPNLINPTNLT